MGHKIAVPESSVSTEDGYALPKEEDLRTYFRLMHERSIPGQEVIYNLDPTGDYIYDPVDFSQPNKILNWGKYNLARTFQASGLELESPPPYVDTGNTFQQETHERWKGTKLEPYAVWIGNGSIGGRAYQYNSNYINSSRDARGLMHNIRSCLDKSVEAVASRFSALIVNQGFVAIRNEKKILEEIELRQTQFPESQVFVLVGVTITDFLEGIYEDNNLADTYRVPVFQSNKLQHNQSAILSSQQIKIKQTFVWDYKIIRRNRYWEASGAIVQNSRVDLAYPEMRKEVIEVKAKRTLDLE